jgi:CheY-like chemotaxis protein
VLRKTRLDLAQVAAKVLLRFEETGRCTHLQMRAEHAPAWIEADEARIELLMTCLLDNACKYTPAGGTVTLEVLGEPHTSVLQIKDTGVGIAAELAESMFDAFTQGERGIERSEGGLGLGLALARKLAHLHGGAISAFSDGPGRGSTFAVSFPRAEAPLAENAASMRPPASSDLLLTIVEDIADNRDMMLMLLEAQGRRINVAADGPSGVQTILEGPSDIAVVDIGLPGFDGLEVARRVRQAPGGERVLLVALTGYGTEADQAKALAAGFDDFLVKPFDPERFEAALIKGLELKHRSTPSGP